MIPDNDDDAVAADDAEVCTDDGNGDDSRLRLCFCMMPTLMMMRIVRMLVMGAVYD